LLQEFYLTILDKLGQENVVANFLSWLDNSPQKGLVEDTCLDKYLSFLSLQIPWFIDIVKYLVTEKFPQHFSHFSHREC